MITKLLTTGGVAAAISAEILLLDHVPVVEVLASLISRAMKAWSSISAR